MKKMMMAMAALLAFAGCRSLTPEKMQSAALAIGCASGMVANETKVDDKSRAAVIEILTVVKGVVPAEGQTFAEAWAPVAKKAVADLIAKGKLDEGQGALVIGGISIAASGLDYVFTAYPKAKAYEELVSAAVQGFTEGFLTTFKPANSKAGPANVEYDKKAYAHLKAKYSK